LPASCRLHPGRLHRQLRSLRTGSVSGCLWGARTHLHARGWLSRFRLQVRLPEAQAERLAKYPRTAGWHDDMFLKRSAVSGQIASYLAPGWPLFSGPLKTPKPALFKCWFRIQILDSARRQRSRETKRGSLQETQGGSRTGCLETAVQHFCRYAKDNLPVWIDDKSLRTLDPRVGVRCTRFPWRYPRLA